VSAADTMSALHFTFGSYTNKKWTDLRAMSWSELAALLTTHMIGRKEGDSIVPAKFRGDRRHKNEAEQIDAALLDSDNGATLTEIGTSAQACGWAAVISSTHSHLTTRTKASRANVERFKRLNPDSAPVDFLVNDKGMLPRVAAGATVAEETDEFIIFKHHPCPKFRVAIPLLRPWRASDYPTQDAANAVWKERIEALAAALGLEHDQSCTDTSRLFYLPRRPADGPSPESLVVEGDPCDLFALPACVSTGKTNGSSGLFDETSHKQIHPDADAGEFIDPDDGVVFDLRAWAREYGRRFRIVDALRARKPGMLTGHVAGANVHCRCPNEDRHTEPGKDGATFIVNAGAGKNPGRSVVLGYLA
jgi:hypothetical protein